MGRNQKKTRLAAMFKLFVMVGLFSPAFGRQPEFSDMVLLNGKILTMDERQPEVEALAIRKDVIVAAGSKKEISKSIGQSTQVIDIRGLFAIPGFIEGHGHLLLTGQAKMELDLRKARNWEEIISMVRTGAGKGKPGEWILGNGWHQEKWDKPPMPASEGYPTDDALNKASPENPVLLTHASGHALFANARARELAGVSRFSTDPEGGRILRDAQGNPSGVFFDTAQDLITRAHQRSLAERTPEQKEAHSREAIRLAVLHCLSKGITSFQDASVSFRDLDVYRKLVQEDALGIRLWAMIHESNTDLLANLDRYKLVGFGDNRLTVRAIKKFMDGALGSHTAWLLEPYTDLPDSTGLNVESTEDILDAARLVIKKEFQLCVHAIGDRANRETLNIFEKVFKEHPELDTHKQRWRIEHAQHLSGVDIPRFAKLGVIASMQAIHCTSDGPWVPKRLGDARTKEGAYVWRSLMQSGALVTNGTDSPVEEVDPIANFYAAVTRKLPNGSSFYPAQRMSREEALRAYTLHNAYAAFEEDIKGSLTPGKLADITILSRDLRNIPEDEIPSTQVVYTIVGGRIMYQGQLPGGN